jgi:two-component system, NarL family, sensor histidine kinase UhpB
MGTSASWQQASSMRRLRHDARRHGWAKQSTRADGSEFCWTVPQHLSETVEPVASRSPTARSALDARAAPKIEPGQAANTSPPQRRWSLLWLVFLANSSVLVVALLLLTFSPIEIDAPIKTGQFLVLLAGFVVLVGVNLLVLRRVLRPLLRLTELMSSVDPDRPGKRLSGAEPRSAEGQELAAAFNAMLDRLESARHQAARTALAAQEAERLRVARELHDEIGQTLTAITIQAERAAESDPASASAALNEIAAAVRESLDEVRRIARELRPEALDDLGLVNALIALCNRVNVQDGPIVERRLQGTLPSLSPDVELVIYRIAQEGLTNAVRHSGAARVTLSLEADAEMLTLRVADDGGGMPPHLPDNTSGIAGMRERALLVGGRLSIASRPGGGTQVQLLIPVEEDSR